MSKNMAQRVHAALLDRRIQAAFQTWSPILKFISQAAGEGIDFEAARRKVHSVKKNSIANLPALVEEFKKQADAAGAVVYEARDAAEANSYVLKVARENSVANVVKSSSTLARETGLRKYLEKAGIDVTETDVGEWIIQLADEKPAHMTAPNAHITIEEVTELLSRASGEKLAAEPQALLDATRKTLRQAFVRADMGISGANIAVAETGTIMILTNEGNGCMTTTMPRVHVALVGIEKLVATFEDATVILRLLSRSNMGMKMPVYISHITGPSSIGSFNTGFRLNGQGPAKLHIVLVDNGRDKMRQSADFREALYCIKCGACINVCPVFRSIGGQTYGHVYQGGIGTVLTAFLHGMDKAKELSGLCMGCKACNEVCPAGIDIPGMITKLKAKISADSGLPLGKKVMYRGILKNPGTFQKAIGFASILQKPYVDDDLMIRRLPYPLNTLAKTISLPSITHTPLADMLPDKKSAKSTLHGVAFYAGCVANYAYPELGEYVLKLLRESGAEAYYPKGQACCGAPAFYDGDIDTALSLARTNIAALEKMDPGYIVTVCPGCAVMLKNEYPRLMRGDSGWSKRAEALSGRVRDFSQLILELAPGKEKMASRNMKVTYHDPCHLKRGLGIYREPRQLLEREGFDLVEMEDADVCCGFGGKNVVEYPELSNSILQRKLDKIEAASVDVVVTNCVACILQLRGGLDKRHSKIRVMHSCELLAKPSKAL